MKSKNGPFKMKKTPAKHTGGKPGMIGSVVGQLGGRNSGMNVYNPNQTGAMGGALGMLGGRVASGIGQGAFFPSAYARKRRSGGGNKRKGMGAFSRFKNRIRGIFG